MATRYNTPNLFTLTGEHAQITYTASSISGEPQLTYKDRTFTGGEIDSLDTGLGNLYSVLLEAIRDLRTLTLSRRLPDINLMEEEEISFSTYAIFTTHHTSIGGPLLVKGALQTYIMLPLRGTAEPVQF